MEKLHNEINGDNIKKLWIAKSFNKCGINPWGDANRFHQHIDQINESVMYKALTNSYAENVLDKITKKQMGFIRNILTK